MTSTVPFLAFTVPLSRLAFFDYLESFKYLFFSIASGSGQEHVSLNYRYSNCAMKLLDA